MRPQTWHLVVLLVVVLLLFGNRLPDVARSMGQSLKIFKKEVKDLREDDDDTPGSATAHRADVPPVTGTTSATGSTSAPSDPDRTSST